MSKPKDKTESKKEKWTKISGIIGIFGFIISLISIGITFSARAKNLTVNFEYYYNGETIVLNGEKTLFIRCRFDNNSELPLSITNVKLCVEKEYIDSLKYPIVITKASFTIGDSVEELTVKSETAPINIASLESHSVILAFQVPNDIDISDDMKSLTFKIYTNRGKPIEKTFILGEDTKCY